MTPSLISERLLELSTLKKGWVDNEIGEPILIEGLEWLNEMFITNPLPEPYVFPTPDGGIQFEWNQYKHSVSIEFDLVNKKAYYHDYDFVTKDADVESDLDLAVEENWQWMVDAMIKLELKKKAV